MSGKSKLLEEALRIAREGIEGLAKSEGKTPQELLGGFANQKPRVPFEEWRYEFEPTAELLPSKEFNPESFKPGDVIIPLVGDRTSTGRKITSIAGEKLETPAITEGGPDYMRGPSQQEDKSVWASGKGIITGLEKRIENALRASEAKGYKDPNVYGSYVTMGPQSGDFSTHTAEAIMGMLSNAKIKRADAKEFDNLMREKFADWPGIMSPKAADYVINANAGEHRKAFIDAMDTAYWRDRGFPDASLARYATATPELVSAPTEAAGYGIARITPSEKPEVITTVHRSYPATMRGEYVGGLPSGLTRDEIFTQFSRGFDADPPARNYVMAKRRSFGMDPNAFQVMEGQDIEDLIRKVTALKGEYADGGEVYDDDDINDALRIAKAGGGGAFSVFMTDANGVDYDAQGNVIPQQERAGVIEAGEPENYESTVKPLIEAAVTPMDRPGMTEPTLLDTMKYATQAAAAGQPTDARGDANWNRMRSEAVRRAMGAPESGASSPYQGPFSYNPSDMAAFANTLIDFSPVALGEVAHDVPYEAVRTGDYGSAALEGGLNALATAPGLKAAGVAGREAVNLVRQNPKIAAALAGTAVMTDPAQAEAGPARWFSKALEVAKAIPMSKMTGEQALAMLRKGTSPEELRWMGAEPFLSGQKSISKDDLVSFLEKNRVQTQDVVLGGGNKPFRREDVVLDNDIKAKYREQMGALQKDQAKAFTDITKAKTKAEIDIANDRLWSIKKQIQYINEAAIDEQIEKMGGLDRAPKYADYSTEGGEGYKENLVILGNKGMPRVVKQGNSWTLRDADNNPVMSSMNHPYFYYDKSDAERAAKAIYREGGKYKSSHWDDPDVLFHTRSQVLDVTPPGANRPYKAWNVDETQSDWGQDARKYGMRDSNTDWKKAYTELAKSSTQKWIEQKAKSAFEAAPHFYDNDIEKALKWATSEAHRIGASRIADELGIRQQLEDLYVKMTSDLDAVAAAPYVGSTEGWTDFAIKKQLDKALDADSDYFTWTPGDVHADRYNLSNFVDEIHYSPSEERLYGLKNKKGVFEKDATPDELVKLIGEGPAQKLLSQPEVESKWHSSPRRILTGVDMNIGGEGMRGYYDKVYPKRVEEVIRKATGAKPQIEVIEVQTANGPRKQLGVRLTDEMREKARFSDFNKGGRVTDGNTYDSNPAVDHAIALTREY